MTEQTITHFYEGDHDRLDGLFKSFQQLKFTDFAKAGSCFRQFKSGLQRHIIWEEEILFPMFERKSGMTAGGPTHMMRLEHAVIKTHLDRIYQQVQLQNPETDEEERKLLETLSAHNMKEEQILYPAIDRSIDADEMDHLFRSMGSLPEDRYNS